MLHALFSLYYINIYVLIILFNVVILHVLNIITLPRIEISYNRLHALGLRVSDLRNIRRTMVAADSHSHSRARREAQTALALSGADPPSPSPRAAAGGAPPKFNQLTTIWTQKVLDD